jgi:hypothetical protein
MHFSTLNDPTPRLTEDESDDGKNNSSEKKPLLSAENLLTVEPPPVAKRKRQRLSDKFLALDPDQNLYKQIRHLQAINKEQARRKTANNVYRALCGNLIICAAKFGAWVSSGSSGMLAEFIHSVVDCGNQSLLLVGLRSSRNSPDRKHPYGYGKSVYFWALVSALG